MKLKFCGHCKNEKLTPERRAELQKRFEEINSMGAERFMYLWLKASQRATDAARALEIDVTDPRMRALLASVCFRILSLKEGD
jgi:hypothetical protein